jgi:hypothetical protein
VDVNFTDNTSQTFTGINISDWYYGSNFAIQGIGRINISNNNLESGSGTDPRLYQIPLSINPTNLSRVIKSVTVTKSGSGGIPNIFAFAADSYNPCEAPTNITAVTTMNGATLLDSSFQCAVFDINIITVLLLLHQQPVQHLQEVYLRELQLL